MRQIHAAEVADNQEAGLNAEAGRLEGSGDALGTSAVHNHRALETSAFHSGRTEVPEREVRALRRAARRLRRRDPARRLAEIALKAYNTSPDVTADALPAQLVAEVCAVIGSRSIFRWRSAQVGAWALGWLELPAEERETVIAALIATTGREEWRWGSQLAAILLRGLVSATPLAVWCYGAKPDLAGGPFSWMAIAYLAMFIPTVLYSAAVDQSRLSGLRTLAARSLGRLQAVAALDPLLDALRNKRRTSERTVRTAFASAIELLLPAAGPGLYSTLPPRTIPNLLWLLGRAKEPLALQILDGLGRFGDGRAVHAVEKLARKARPPAVQAAARRVLPVLEERKAREEAQGMLLRAAAAPETPAAATLLRAAAGQTSIDSSALLRAAEVYKEGSEA